MASPLYLCVQIRDFAVQALARSAELRGRALAVMSGSAPLERVFSTNERARQCGVEVGMSRVQAESFAITLLRRDHAQEERAFAELMACAKEFSPRAEVIAGPREESCGATLVTESMELDHPVDLLEPLLFLLSQMLEQVLQRAAQRVQAITAVESCLTMERGTRAVGGVDDDMAYEHRRMVRPTLPERDRMTLLKLMQLDMELHPPEAAVIGLRLTAYSARAQVAQQGLFAAQAPEAGRLEILLARLCKLVGEGRVGVAELLDSHAPEAFRLASFEIGQTASRSSAKAARTASALRMVRPPRAIRVELCNEAPTVMHYEGQRVMLQAGSGPWRTSGAWWTHPAWCREEWDVVLKEEPHRCLRLAHDPAAACWYVIGIYD